MNNNGSTKTIHILTLWFKSLVSHLTCSDYFHYHIMRVNPVRAMLCEFKFIGKLMTSRDGTRNVLSIHQSILMLRAKATTYHWVTPTGPSIQTVPFWNIPWVWRAVNVSNWLSTLITKVSPSVASMVGGLWETFSNHSNEFRGNKIKNLRPFSINTYNLTFKEIIRVCSSICNVPVKDNTGSLGKPSWTGN